MLALFPFRCVFFARSPACLQNQKAVRWAHLRSAQQCTQIHCWIENMVPLPMAKRQQWTNAITDGASENWQIHFLCLCNSFVSTQRGCYCLIALFFFYLALVVLLSLSWMLLGCCRNEHRFFTSSALHILIANSVAFHSSFIHLMLFPYIVVGCRFCAREIFVCESAWIYRTISMICCNV